MMKGWNMILNLFLSIFLFPFYWTARLVTSS
jgi:hypothetical protein